MDPGTQQDGTEASMNIEIEIEDIRRKKSALSTILDTMSVPTSRRDLDRDSNVRWLSRNLRIENGDHPMFDTAKGLVDFLFRKQYLTRRHG